MDYVSCFTLSLFSILPLVTAFCMLYHGSGTVLPCASIPLYMDGMTIMLTWQIAEKKITVWQNSWATRGEYVENHVTNQDSSPLHTENTKKIMLHPSVTLKKKTLYQNHYCHNIHSSLYFEGLLHGIIVWNVTSLLTVLPALREGKWLSLTVFNSPFGCLLIPYTADLPVYRLNYPNTDAFTMQYCPQHHIGWCNSLNKHFVGAF